MICVASEGNPGLYDSRAEIESLAKPSTNIPFDGASRKIEKFPSSCKTPKIISMVTTRHTFSKLLKVSIGKISFRGGTLH